MKINKNI